MLKGGGTVSLNEKVTNPGRAITWNETEKEEPPTSRSDEENNEGDSYRRAGEVQ